MKHIRHYRDRLYAIPGFKMVFELVFILIIAFIIRTFGFGLYQVPTGSMETTLLVGERFFADKLSYWFRKPEYGEIIAFNDPRYKYSHNFTQNLWQRYVSWNVSNWTKRVIGKPGDHIKGVIEDGKPVVYRNGKKLDEPYINKYPIVAVWSSDPRLASINNTIDYVHKSFDPAFAYNSIQQPFYRIDPTLLKLIDGQAEILAPYTPYRDGIDVYDVKLGENQYWVMGDNRLGSWDSRGWGPLDGVLIHGKIIFRIWSIDSNESWWIFDLLRHPIEFWKKIRWSRCFQWVS